MKTQGIIGRVLAGAALCALIFSACSNSGQSTNTSAAGGGATSAPGSGTAAAATVSRPAAVAAAPDAAQTNPPGDIPDTQLFVTYRSPAGYAVLFPEGWSRTTNGSTVTFRSNYDGERVDVRPKADPSAAIRTMFPGVAALKLSHVGIHGAPSTQLTFTSTSQQDPVTGKSITLENASYVVSHGSREAILSLWAPKGSDNVDQWKKISQSFQWR